LAILLYCVVHTPWPITEENGKRLEGFHHNCLRKILNITWKDKVKNESVRRKVNQSLLECTVQGRRLRWFGRVQRMENVSNARQALRWIPTEKRKTEDYMARYNNEGHQQEECKKVSNLPNSSASSSFGQ